MDGRMRSVTTTAMAVVVLLVATTTSGVIEAQTGDSSSPSPSPVAPSGNASAEFVVAADGSGDFVSIVDAVDVAVDGDAIRIAPGVYDGPILIEEDITIRGDDPVRVIIRSPTETSDCGPLSMAGCVIAVVDASASISGVTLESRSADEDAAAVYVSGGAPTLAAINVDGGVAIADGSVATVRESVVSGDIRVSGQGTRPTVAASRLARVRVGDGSAPTIEQSAIEHLRLNDSAGLMWGNSIVGMGQEMDGPLGVGVAIVQPRDGLTIRENRIAEHRVGIDVSEGSSLTISFNSIEHNGIGLRMDAVGDASIRGNAFCENERNVRVRTGPPPRDVREFCSSGG